MQPPTDHPIAEGTRLQAVRRLLPHHCEQLQASGLTDKTIEASGVYSLEDDATARQLINLWEGAESPVTRSPGTRPTPRRRIPVDRLVREDLERCGAAVLPPRPAVLFFLFLKRQKVQEEKQG